jgi:hypothetical protein
MPFLGFPILLKQKRLNCRLGRPPSLAEEILTWRVQKVPKSLYFDPALVENPG